ncbi:MBL fold metallo-hydrolase [Halosegnis longus]|uniref:MBL fold metallo-hydrolase n=1 Tax=Halosegnis longus TaxID=2216012 RepID=A0AAJ4UW49_9EURY|nr:MULTISPECIES: MBL fold metallo-hydrolase [Halobacteriales]RNJ26706.1 MBL fold metallo-hydrolase [Salella cibi]
MHVHRVPVTFPNVPTGSVNAYLLAGESTVLVDPPERHPELDSLVADRGLDYVLATHHHSDHAGGIAHYAREHDATVACRAGRVAEFRAATGVDPDRTYREGTTIAGVRVVDTPGHAPEHVAFATPEGLIAGDLAIGEGSVAVAAPEGDMRAYVTSLRRVWARAPDRIYPGHGPIIEDARDACERLIAHRRKRERRILDVVADGADTLDAVTDGAYTKDISAVRELAVATVEAHVEKLAVEGRLRWDGEQVRPV